MSLTTRLSLINSLKNSGGEAAWERFYHTYSGVLVSFARRQGCDDHAALDVLQESLMVVLRKLGTFEYDTERGRFRNWLLTIAANKVREAKRRAKLDRMISLDAGEEEGRSLAETLSDSSHDATEVLENDWRQTLVEEALRQILNDPRTDAESVAVFRAVALENQPVSTVAIRHGMTANNVYQIKNRLLNRIRSIVAQLENGLMPQDND